MLKFVKKQQKNKTKYLCLIVFVLYFTNNTKKRLNFELFFY